MKKLLLILPDLDCGGAQRVMITLLSQFSKKGYKISLLVLCGNGMMREHIPEGIEVYSATKYRYHSIILALISIFTISRYILKYQPDAILSSVTGANLAALIACQIVRYPRRLVVRHENTGQVLRGQLKKLALKMLYKKASRVITITPEAKQDLISTCPDLHSSISVVYNPVDVEDILEKAEQAPAHEWLHDRHVPVIVAVGRLEEPKDYGTLILAFREMRRTKELRLAILGEGSMRSSLEKMIADLRLEGDVLLTGSVQNPYTWIKHSDIYVMSSKSEGQPVAMIEAMVLGAKIVSTDCRSGPRELLNGGEYGSLVPVGDFKALAEEIIRKLENESSNIPLIKARGAEYGPRQAVAKHLELLFR